MSNKNGRRVISVSPKKNIEMVVYHNTNGRGGTQSLTFHEPINPAKSVYRRSFGRK